MKEYIDVLKKIFDPVAIFMKDEEFIIVVKDEMDVGSKAKELSETIDDDLSLMILTKHEFENLKNKNLGEKII
ncbi:MAG: hypothetical protein ACPL3B_01020 [Fervidobacterium sp.]|jgi:hypothetical protein